MFAAIPLIADRLAAALGSAWATDDGTTPQDRRALPRADVRLEDAALTNASGPNVTLQPRYTVTLVISTQAATPYALLDAAVDAAIAQLHHWRPAARYQRLAMQGLRAVDFADQALIGFELTFAITTTRPGCND